MTRIHKHGIYKDGYKSVEYCRVCSAEGDQLLEACPGNFGDPVKKVLDAEKPKPINIVIENSAE